ncbi:hypothetical protein Ahy_B04g068925 [Arachis hypogaea]|uniref:CCHC-type domain-containing protein n=1 Tax=Arachis hypogaea TaxID=3818 RepID=A0A444ZB46_ARAHY|nr:hypothetical protein Ahy_B04g068925 [Arachis hypogaea]
MHTISAIQNKNCKRIKEYCHEWLTIEAYKRTYCFNVNPVKRQDLWEKTPSPAPVPPPIKPKPDRPTKKRRRDKGEHLTGSSTRMKSKYNSIRCMYCGEVGHNKRGCAKKKKMDTEEQARQMQLQFTLVKEPTPPTYETNTKTNDVQSFLYFLHQSSHNLIQPKGSPPKQESQLPDAKRGRPPKLHIIKRKARLNASTKLPVVIFAETLKGTSFATAKKMQSFMIFVLTPGFKYPRKKD